MRAFARVLSISVLLLSALGAATASAGPSPDPAAPPSGPLLTPHPPIYINGNADFTAPNGVSSGSGTSIDPYVIQGWDISAATGIGVSIQGTSAYFVVRDSYIHSGGGNFHGIELLNVTNGLVRNVTSLGNFAGIWLQDTNPGIPGTTAYNRIEYSEFASNLFGVVGAWSGFGPGT